MCEFCGCGMRRSGTRLSIDQWRRKASISDRVVEVAKPVGGVAESGGDNHRAGSTSGAGSTAEVGSHAAVGLRVAVGHQITG